MRVIALADHAELQEVASCRGEPLVISRSAVVAVLAGLRDASISPQDAQSWASFVRWGHVAPAVGPIRSLDIEYDPEWELPIADAVSRMDELGDIVDGEITRAEIAILLMDLGHRSS